jgi:hypothetical protein
MRATGKFIVDLKCPPLHLTQLWGKFFQVTPVEYALSHFCMDASRPNVSGSPSFPLGLIFQGLASDVGGPCVSSNCKSPMGKTGISSTLQRQEGLKVWVVAEEDDSKRT